MANEYAIYSTQIIVNSLKLGRYTTMRTQAQTLQILHGMLYLQVC